ncbi:hypothetical protein [Pseudooceanicola nanhaiensis]|uniref:hypothetical protein n=1 Tax=Pseudooceanicola nanhaiensis TaxID=375761 RepID=UPI001CD20E7A|nr:hypothetical protein [Pseudooceanicola nanhaiensis]MCA0920218.1 hypothetical protein [Pseudooceanicola nanhaiensis]
MKILFLATRKAPAAYVLDGETINGFDLSPLEHGGQFLGNATTRAIGLRGVHRDSEGELHVTLCQSVIASRVPNRPAHWRGSEVEIDAAAYDSATCYVIPTGLSDLQQVAEDAEVDVPSYAVAWRDGIAQGEAGWCTVPVLPVLIESVPMSDVSKSEAPADEEEATNAE